MFVLRQATFIIKEFSFFCYFFHRLSFSEPLVQQGVFSIQKNRDYPPDFLINSYSEIPSVPKPLQQRFPKPIQLRVGSHRQHKLQHTVITHRLNNKRLHFPAQGELHQIPVQCLDCIKHILTVTADFKRIPAKACGA